jgi:hypothetical protein
MNGKNDELSALKRKLAELEAKVNAPPPPPFTPEPYQRWDPTAGMSMPRSTMQEMVRVIPDGMIQGIVHDNRAPTGRPGVIPQHVQPAASVRGPGPAGDGTGWRTVREYGADGQHPTPGIAHADRIADEFARRDREELKQKLGKR